MSDITTTVQGAMDRLPAAVRHGLIMFVAALLSWASAYAAGLQVPGNPIATGVFSSAGVSIVGTATLWFTKLTKQYGVGSEK